MIKLKDRKKTEAEITKEIRGYLIIKKIYHWKVWQGPMSKAGVADILGILPDGRLLAIEVKTLSGKLSSNQEAFLLAIRIRNGVAIVARSVEDVEAGIREWSSHRSEIG